MPQPLRHVLILLTVLTLISGCAGTRNSYEQLIVAGSDPPIIRMQVNDDVEVLAIGDGFPGWWGYYPAMLSCDPEIAEIRCEEQRSLIPFREPGIVFGGSVCRLYALKVGETDLYTGNQHILSPETCTEANHPGRIHLIVVAPQQP